MEPRFGGEKVVVIGGGDVGMDVARTALRLGAKEVHLYCLEERDEMPAHAREILDAEREGVVVHPGWGPAFIAGGGGGAVERIDFCKCVSVFDDDGRFAPTIDGSISISQQADRVLFAIGQKPGLGFLDDVEGTELQRLGSIEVSADSLQTSIAGVFAGGDVVSGPASVIEAIAHGRRAASGIDRYLGGDGDIYFPLLDDTELDAGFDSIEGFSALKRTQVPHLDVGEAVSGFDIVETGYSAAAAVREAQRCLRCDLRLSIRTVPAPPEPWLPLNEESIATLPESEGVYQLLDDGRVVYAIAGVQNLRRALSEILSTSTKARFFLFEEDPMYSKRESELIQAYLRQHGRMPPGEGEDDLDDLF